jgi:hypothetical protein
MHKHLILASIFVLATAFFIIGCAKNAYENARQADTVEALESFIRRHPRSKYALEARNQVSNILAEKDFKSTRLKHTIEAYENFLREHPYSEYVEKARSAIRSLKAQEARYDYEKLLNNPSIEKRNEYLYKHPGNEHEESLSSYIAGYYTFLENLRTDKFFIPPRGKKLVLVLRNEAPSSKPASDNIDLDSMRKVHEKTNSIAQDTFRRMGFYVTYLDGPCVATFSSQEIVRHLGARYRLLGRSKEEFAFLYTGYSVEGSIKINIQSNTSFEMPYKLVFPPLEYTSGGHTSWDQEEVEQTIESVVRQLAYALTVRLSESGVDLIVGPEGN